MDVYEAVVGVGAVTSGLMAGLLFIFSTTVMPTIQALPPAHGLASMQTINRRITEPLFGLIFVGSIASSLAAIVLGLGDIGDRLLGVAAGVVHLVGFFAITAAVHLPINARLDRADPSSEADLQDWPSAAARWHRFNHVRASAAIVACVLFVLALIRQTG